MTSKVLAKSVGMRAELWDRLGRYSEKSGLSVSEIVRRAVTQYLRGKI